MKNTNRFVGYVFLIIFVGILGSIIVGAIIAAAITASSNLNPVTAWILGTLISFSLYYLLFAKDKCKEIKSDMGRLRDNV